MTAASSDTWIEAGPGRTGAAGVEGVRVEVLAKNLGVTKGGFYRRFRDRAALLEAMLQSWSAGRIAAIEAQTSLDGVTARERLRALILLYSERMNTEGDGDRACDPAMGALRRDRRPARLPSVDAARLKNVGHLYRATGLAAEEADAQAFPVLLLHLRPEPVVSRTRPAQAGAAGGEVGRQAARRLLKARPGHAGRALSVCMRARLRRALQLLGAFAAVAAALLDPLQAASGVGGLVGVVLVDAGVHPRLAGGLLGIFRIDGGRKHRGARGAAGAAAARLSFFASWRLPSAAPPARRRAAAAARPLRRRRIGLCGNRSTSGRRACRRSWRPGTSRCIPARSAPAPATSPRTRRNPTPQPHTIIWLERSSLVSLGHVDLKTSHPSATTACDNAPAGFGKIFLVSSVDLFIVCSGNCARPLAAAMKRRGRCNCASAPSAKASAAALLQSRQRICPGASGFAIRRREPDPRFDGLALARPRRTPQRRRDARDRHRRRRAVSVGQPAGRADLRRHDRGRHRRDRRPAAGACRRS